VDRPKSVVMAVRLDPAMNAAACGPPPDPQSASDPAVLPAAAAAIDIGVCIAP
jgi:hypothetical protein